MKEKEITIKASAVILFVFSFLFVFFNSKNSPLYLFNEWGDVNIYFSVGKGMMNGLIPYKDIFDHKGPLIFFLYGISYLISNTGFAGMYIIESLFLFINLLFAFKLARLYLNSLFSLLTALIYAAVLFTKTYYGGSAEEFISLFIIVSFYYFILYFKDENQDKKITYRQMFIHGLMFGLAFLSKLSVCVFWLPIILAACCSLISRKEYKNILYFGLYFLCGFVVSLLPFIVYFGLNNSISEAYFGYITFNSLYAEFNPDLSFLRKVAGHLYKLTIYNYVSFSLLLLGLFLLSFTSRYIKNPIYRVGVFFSFVFSFIVICLSKYIMTYAHIVIYVYAIFGLIFVFEFLSKYIQKIKFQTVIITVSCLLVLVIGINDKRFFNQDFDCLLRRKECNYMQKQFAEIINREHNPTLLNIGLDLGVYTKANIIPSYKYFFYPNIPYHIFPEIRDSQMALIENKEPMFVVMGDKSAFYNVYKDLPALNDNYKLISVYNQDDDVYDKQVFLYKRKD